MTLDPEDLVEYLGQVVTIQSPIWGTTTGQLTQIIHRPDGKPRAIMLDRRVHVPTEQATITEGTGE